MTGPVWVSKELPVIGILLSFNNYNVIKKKIEYFNNKMEQINKQNYNNPQKSDLHTINFHYGIMVFF